MRTWDRTGALGAASRAAAALAAVLLAMAACSRQPEAAALDPRIAVNLDAEQRAAVLGEMRTMLGSVDGVLRGVSAWDTAAVRAAALRSGMAAAADPALERILPRAWLDIAEPVHMGFDSLAAAAVKRGATRDSVVARLGAITPHCVSCHSMYRLGMI